MEARQWSSCCRHERLVSSAVGLCLLSSVAPSGRYRPLSVVLLLCTIMSSAHLTVHHTGSSSSWRSSSICTWCSRNSSRSSVGGPMMNLFFCVTLSRLPISD